MKNLKNMVTKKINDDIEKLKKEYQRKYDEKDGNLNKKFNDMSEIIMKSNIGKKEENMKFSFCNTVHFGIKCEQCNRNPITGYRYKCSECPNYNLCQECEEKNSLNGKHPHDFIKIRNIKINKK